MAKRLGRGLGALLGNVDLTQLQPDIEHGTEELSEISSQESEDLYGEVHELSVRQIDPGSHQPREDFDAEEMAHLVQSVQQHGVIQPILVRPVGDRFELVAGERRLRASLEAGLEMVPVRVLQVEERQVYEMALVENLQRKDLNALEKARAFSECLATFELSHEELATALGINRSTVSNIIRLLELPQDIQVQLRNGSISAGHGRALLGLDSENQQCVLPQKIIEEGLSVREVENIVTQPMSHADNASAISGERSGSGEKKPSGNKAHLSLLEDQLRISLGARVEIKTGRKSSGRIVIHFSSNDDFERLLDELSSRSGSMAVPRDRDKQ